MKCIICDKEATGRLSPDIDLQGLGFCDEHREDVQVAYFILWNEGGEAFNRFIKHNKKEK